MKDTNIDRNLAGDVLKAVPLEQLISAPLNAIIQAGTAASKAYLDFVQGVAKLEDLTFTSKAINVNDAGEALQSREMHINVPPLALVQHPVYGIEEARVAFSMEITQSFAENEKSEKSADIDAEAKIGFAWFSTRVKVKGKMSNSSETTRKSDTRAKYEFNVVMKKYEMPESMGRVIDFITQAAVKPVLANETATIADNTSHDGN